MLVTTTSLDRTNEFKTICFKLQTPSSSSNTPPHKVVDHWTLQAQQVATNLRSFETFLLSIRSAYLDLSGIGNNSSNTQSQSIRLNDNDDDDSNLDLFQQWKRVRYLNDKERDEIDYSVKIAIRKSFEKVRKLEELEKIRISNERKRSKLERSSNKSNKSTLSKLFAPPPPSSSSTTSSSSSSSSESLNSHRNYITLYLNELLQSVSERQRLQQESRVKQQFERNATLTTGNNNDFPLLFQRDGNVDEEEEEEEEDNLLLAGRQELTQEQIQQFEQEESLLLQSTRQDLQSLQQAETSLLEISSLQTQLALHLNQQSELTDQLWSEAIEVSGRVNDANSQLKKAKERGKDSRISLLVFLIASSFTLLFLDYYSS